MEPEDLVGYEKLPKRAQEFIKTACYQRHAAIKALNEFEDSQTKSRIWVSEVVCDEKSPTSRIKYVQGNRVTLDLGGRDREVGIRIDKDQLHINCGGGIAIITPQACNCFILGIKER